MNGIELVADILKTEGVEWMACFPSNPLIEAAAQRGIRPIAFRHERGAVMAADGFSRVSDRERFGVVAVQAQAGAENALGGISQAFADNIPVLVLPGGNDLARLPVRPNYSAAAAWQPMVKSVEAILRPEQVAEALRRAFSALRNGAGGPVVVELTADVCAREVPEAACGYRPPASLRQAPAAAEIDAAAAALLAARRPLIWAGAGVLAARATEQLRALAELAAVPVFCTMPGKSAFDERHPLSLGAGSGATTGQAHHWLQTCDLVLALGSSLTRTPYGQSLRGDITLIQNTHNPDDINKDEWVDIGLVGDTALTLDALLEAVRDRLHGAARDRQELEAEIARVRGEWLSQWQPLLDSDARPISTYRVIREMDRTLDRDNSIVTHDAGAPRDSIVPFYTATTPHSYVGWGKTTHLGFGIPLMIGAKLACPERFCLNLMGDGAFGMSGTDLETAARAGVPITTVLLNNGGMATYPGGFPTAREKYGVSNMLGDYAAIAEGMGATGITVTEPGELAPATCTRTWKDVDRAGTAERLVTARFASPRRQRRRHPRDSRCAGRARGCRAGAVTSERPMR
jgi:thiamine pyrophosphate-dependent acetolactate synthase large subunit-like protein